jgi:excisionase family DNA binding protein
MRPAVFWCEDCHAFTLWFSPEEAAELVCKCSRTLYVWIEEGKVHAHRLPGRQWIVCWCSVCGERARNANSCKNRLVQCRKTLQEVEV